jgi:hypothetical protein
MTRVCEEFQLHSDTKKFVTFCKRRIANFLFVLKSCNVTVNVGGKNLEGFNEDDF